MKKYNIIYSLGRDCACSSYLKKNGLRLTSGPFDWLTNAGFEQRFDLILNDFENFLNKEDLIPMPKPTQFPADKNNDYYENKRTGLYFWHDFPADKSFDQSYPLIKQKYNRRIDRFYKNIKKHKRVLLVWFSQLHNTDKDLIVELCNKFCKKVGKRVDFLIIEHIEGLQEVKTVQLQENIIKHCCHTTRVDEKGVPQTFGNETLINPIFQQYKIMIPFYTKIIKAITKILIKILCLFVPVKKWRKKLRSLYK